jgi:hypothetical protein
VVVFSTSVNPTGGEHRFASSRIREKGFLISDEPGIDNEIFTDEPITPIQGVKAPIVHGYRSTRSLK